MLACSRLVHPPLGTVTVIAGCGYSATEEVAHKKCVVGGELSARSGIQKLIAGARSKARHSALGRLCCVRQVVAPDVHTTAQGLCCAALESTDAACEVPLATRAGSRRGRCCRRCARRAWRPTRAATTHCWPRATAGTSRSARWRFCSACSAPQPRVRNPCPRNPKTPLSMPERALEVLQRMQRAATQGAPSPPLLVGPWQGRMPLRSSLSCAGSWSVAWTALHVSHASQVTGMISAHV